MINCYNAGMKNFYASILCGLGAVAMVSPVFAAEGWMTDLPAALQKAKLEGKLVLVDFTGSDWCASCIKLRRTVLDTPEFRAYAADSFVLMEVDLPQRKDFDAELRARNEAIAARYHVAGYPTVMVLNSNGDVVGGFEGAVSRKTAEKLLNEAKLINHHFLFAGPLSGVGRARALMEAYNLFPESKSFAVAREALMNEIKKADPHNVTGIHDAAAVREQAQQFLQERNALRITDPAMGKLLELQLKAAYPANRPAVMMELCQHALATAETVEDILAAKKMFEELLPHLPADEAADIQHFINTYFSDPAALLQMLKGNRY